MKNSPQPNHLRPVPSGSPRPAEQSRTVRIAGWLLDHRLALAMISVLAMVVGGVGVTRIEMHNDYRYFFEEDDPERVAFQRLQDTYTKNDNILLVLAPKGGDVFTRDVLAATEAITKRAWQTPYAIRVDSLSNYQHTRADGDDLVVRELVENSHALTDAELERVRSIALHEPLLRRRLINDEGSVSAVNITLELPGKSSNEQVPAIEHVRGIAADIETTYPDIVVHLSGMVALNNSFFEASMSDLTTLMPVMFLALLLTLVLFLRSGIGTLAAVAVVGASVAVAVGVAGWIGIPITAPSSTAPTMILTLAIADSVHIIVTALQKMRRDNFTKGKAIIESMRVNAGAVFVTSITTIIGFLSLNASDVQPFRDLGNITAIGVAAAFVFSFTLLPALFMLLPLRLAQVTASLQRFSLLGRLADIVIAHRRTALALSAVFTLGSAALLPSNQLNDQFVDYFSDSFEFRRDTDFIVENLTGIYTIEFSIAAPGAGGVAEPTYLKTLDAFAQWYRTQEGVVHVNTFSDVMRKVNKSMNGDRPEAYRLPDSREVAAQYLLLYEMSLPYGLDLNNQLDIEKSASRFIVTTENLNSVALRDLAAAGEHWLVEHAPSMHGKAASPGLMFAYVSARNIQSMLWGTAGAMLLISLILIIALRSLSFGGLSILPNIVPAITAFGLWGLFVGKVDLGLSMVAAMSLGIVVDDTVHFLSKYVRYRRELALSAEDAVRAAYGSVGRALVVTSVVLIAGFGILSFSPFGLNGGMGQLTALTIALALLTDFVMLPALLLLTAREPAEPAEPQAAQTLNTAA